MMAIGVALWKYVMNYAPLSPNFINRDRFVLSNGHTCLFQYIFLHFTGYRSMTFDQLKSYHSDRVDTLCPGHPEIENEGIEVTTGELTMPEARERENKPNPTIKVPWDKGLQMLSV